MNQKHKSVNTPNGTMANFNRIRNGQEVYFDGKDYWWHTEDQQTILIADFDEDWSNEDLIQGFMIEVKDMLDHYKDPAERVDFGEDNPKPYDQYIKSIFYDLANECAEQMGQRIEVFDDPVDDGEDPITTTHELARVLSRWPKDTTLFVNVMGALDPESPQYEYQWHFPKAYAPSSSELQQMFKHGPSFTTIDIDPEVQGC